MVQELHKEGAKNEFSLLRKQYRGEIVQVGQILWNHLNKGGDREKSDHEYDFIQAIVLLGNISSQERLDGTVSGFASTCNYIEWSQALALRIRLRLLISSVVARGWWINADL